MNTQHLIKQRATEIIAAPDIAAWPSVRIARIAGATLLIMACALAAAQDTKDAAPTPSDNASPQTSGGGAGSSLINSLGSLFGRMKAALPDVKPGDQGNTQGSGQEYREGTEPADKSKDSTSQGDQKGAAGFNIVDIDSWSRTSNVVHDPQCKTMIQPFGLSDNAASLAVLAAKFKIKGFFTQLGGPGMKQAPGANQNSTADIVKLAARNLNWLPMEAELALGKSMMGDSEILGEDKNKDTRRVYAEAKAVLADIIKGLPGPLPYDFEVKVLTKSYGGASALPGGIILVDRDLFKKGADQDFTYFVISHEVAHVLQRHETRAYQAKLADGIDSLDGLQKLMSSVGGSNPASLLAYGTSLKKLFVNFSEAQEMQADSCAVRMLAKRNPDSKMLAAKIRKIDQLLGPAGPETVEGPQGNSLADHLKYMGDGIMERHPTTNKRRANLQTAFATATAPTGSTQALGLAPSQK